MPTNEPPDGARWFAVGQSTATDPRAAGSEAARQALQHEDARLLVVFCSDTARDGALGDWSVLA